MIRTPAIPIPYERQQVIENRVREGFYGYIGNEEAVYAIERDLILALADEQPRLARAFLLWGPSSAGKTDLSKRVAGALGVPFIRLDGHAVKTREELFDMIDEKLLAAKQNAKHAGEQSGMRVLEYPPFAVMIDCAQFGILKPVDFSESEAPRLMRIIIGQQPEPSAPAPEPVVFSLHVWPNYDQRQVRAWLESWPHVSQPFAQAIEAMR